MYNNYSYYKEDYRNEYLLVPRIMNQLLQHYIASTKEDIKKFIIAVCEERYSENLHEFMSRYCLDRNEELFNSIFDLLKSYTSWFSNVSANRVYFYETFYVHRDIDNIDELINLYLNEYKDDRFNDIYYEKIFKDNVSSFYVASKLVKEDANLAPLVFKYLNKEDRKKIIDKYYKEIYKKARPSLSKEDADYTVSKILEKNEIYLSHDKEKYESGIFGIMMYNRSNLLDKLKKRFGKSYVEKTGKSLNDDDEFIYTMFNSKVLDSIYSNPVYSANDIITIKIILNYFDEKGRDTKPIRDKIEFIKRTQGQFERNLYNFIATNKDNEEKLNEFLDKHNINIDNYFKTIQNKRFLESKIKESLLLILSKHFKNDYISVYDILDLVQEAHDRNISLDDVIKENGINMRYFKKVYDKIKDENPKIYAILQTSKQFLDKHNKKLIKYYIEIINNKVTSYDEFIERYKKTPEEILKQFEETNLYDDVYDSIFTWYDFSSKEDKKTSIKK